MAAAAVDPTVEEPRKLPPGLHRLAALNPCEWRFVYSMVKHVFWTGTRQ